MKKLLNYLASPDTADNLKKYFELEYPQIKHDEDVFNLMAKHHIETLLRSAPKMYKIYTIPKRNGGNRTIAHPAKGLKATQRDLSKYLVDILPVHSCAFAYIKNKSIKDNALVHAKNKFLLKMDLVNFFNNINDKLLNNELVENDIPLTTLEITQVNKLSFWCPTKDDDGKMILSVGAPISPLISNFIMYRFDSKLSELAISNKVKYSRYADDIFLSTNVPNVLGTFVNVVELLLLELYGGKLVINKTKTVFSSKANNRHVTGLTINNLGEVSLGRKRKRVISSLVHKFSIGILDSSEIERLRGLLSFSSSVEPEFITRLENKYTFKLIDKIIRGLG